MCHHTKSHLYFLNRHGALINQNSVFSRRIYADLPGSELAPRRRSDGSWWDGWGWTGYPRYLKVETIHVNSIACKRNFCESRAMFKSLNVIDSFWIIFAPWNGNNCFLFCRRRSGGSRADRSWGVRLQVSRRSHVRRSQPFPQRLDGLVTTRPSEVGYSALHLPNNLPRTLKRRTWQFTSRLVSSVRDLKSGLLSKHQPRRDRSRPTNQLENEQFESNDHRWAIPIHPRQLLSIAHGQFTDARHRARGPCWRVACGSVARVVQKNEKI